MEGFTDTKMLMFDLQVAFDMTDINAVEDILK